MISVFYIAGVVPDGQEIHRLRKDIQQACQDRSTCGNYMDKSMWQA